MTQLNQQKKNINNKCQLKRGNENSFALCLSFLKFYRTILLRMNAFWLRVFSLLLVALVE